MTTIITADSSADLLALIPHLAGYTPRKSVVVVPFREGHSVGMLRVDTPTTDIDAFAATTIGTACRLPDTDAVALAVFADGPLADCGAREVLDALRIRAHACGLHLIDALAVADDGWASYRDVEVPKPRSRAELRAASQAGIAPPRRDQHAGSAVGRAPKVRRRRVSAALARTERAARARLAQVSAPSAPRDDLELRARLVLTELADVTEAWESALAFESLDDDVLTDERAALLLWCLARPVLRDVALAYWSHGPDMAHRVLAAQLEWEDTSDYPAGPLLLAGEGPRPDGRRLRRTLHLLRGLAALASGRRRADALASAAWVAWALGLGTHAGTHAQEALRLDPSQGLARAIDELSTHGYLPGWAFERPEP